MKSAILMLSIKPTISRLMHVFDYTARPAAGSLHGVMAEVEGWEARLWVETRHDSDGRHVSEIEAARNAGCGMIVAHKEVTVAVGVRAGQCNMRWVEDVGVDEVELKISDRTFQGSSQLISFLIPSNHSGWRFSTCVLQKISPLKSSVHSGTLHLNFTSSSCFR